MQELDSVRLVVALRTARAAVGWSQEELALHLGISKTTLARAELLEGGLRAEQLAQIVRLYRTLGVEMDFMAGDEVTIRMSVEGLKRAQERLLNLDHRRRDRKKGPVGLIEGAMRDPSKLQSK